MALLITDTLDGNPQRMRCAVECGARMLAGAVFVAWKEGPWHS
jgi:hypothetical protein